MRDALTRIHQETYNTQAGIAADALNQTDEIIYSTHKIDTFLDIIELSEMQGFTTLQEIKDFIKEFKTNLGK